MLSILPFELILMIGSLLDDPDLNRLALTCRPFYNVLNVRLYRSCVKTFDNLVLHWAAAKNQRNTALYAISAGVDVNRGFDLPYQGMRWKYGTDPYHGRYWAGLGEGCREAYPTPIPPVINAIFFGSIEMVNLLREHGGTADPDLELLVAVKTGRLAMVKYLLDTRPAGALAKSYEILPIAISIAVNRISSTDHNLEERFGIIKLLIKHGAPINKENGTTLLIYAKTYEVVKILLEAGTSLAVDTSCWQHPLLTAVLCKDHRWIKLLLEYGVDPNCTETGYDEISPIFFRIGGTRFPSLRYRRLLEGVETLADDPLSTLPATVRMTSVFLEHNINVKAVDRNNENVLFHVVTTRCVESVRLFIEAGADVNHCSRSKLTPLHVAAQHGAADMCALLIDYGAIIDARNHYQSTPLHKLTSVGQTSLQHRVDEYIETAKLLLGRGADLNAKDRTGQTPFMKSIYNGPSKLMEMLATYPNQDYNVIDKKRRNPTKLAFEKSRALEMRILELKRQKEMAKNVENKEGNEGEND